jgi:hypothetical protein
MNTPPNRIYISDSRLVIEHVGLYRLLDKLTSLDYFKHNHWSSFEKFCYLELNEEAIVTVMNFFKRHSMEIDPLVVEYYNTIKNWKKEDIISKYSFFSEQNKLARDAINKEINSSEFTNDIIADRSIRYQYFIERNKEPETLTSSIANRHKPYIWLDSKKINLTNLVSSLAELKRLPVLFVFDEGDECQYATLIKDAFANNNIIPGIDTCFTISNGSNKTYNSLINYEPNNEKLLKKSNRPLQYLISNWTPMSVVYIESNLRNNKTGMYVSTCDLIIAYSEIQPLNLEMNIL